MSRPNSRDPEKDPAAALGQTLRRLREAAGIPTWAAAGARIGYGEDLIRKAESGAQVPSEVPFLKMLKLYQVPDLMRPAVIDMWKLARKAKGPIPEFAPRPCTTCPAWIPTRLPTRSPSACSASPSSTNPMPRR